MRGRRIAIAAVILMAAICLNLPVPVALRAKRAARDNLMPYQNVMSLFLARARRSVLVFLHAQQVVREKEALLAEVATLRHEVRRLKTLERQNDELRRLLGFQKRQNRRLVLCEVIARGDPSGWWQTLTLNRGSDSGIRNNMAAVTVDGLVGRTQGVSRHSCDVLLISDPNCRVACRLAEGSATGIVRGKGVSVMGEPKLEMLGRLNPLQMDYVHRDVKIRGKARIETSGLGGVYPEGIEVGWITSVSGHRSGLFQTATVQPFAALRSLKYVFIMVD